MAEVKAMTAEELGRFVCVIKPIAGCLHRDRTITVDGLWVKTGEQFSSAHADCFAAWQAEQALPVSIRRDGTELARVADSDAAFAWLLKHQGQSVSYAIRYGGYRVIGEDGKPYATYAGEVQR